MSVPPPEGVDNLLTSPPTVKESISNQLETLKSNNFPSSNTTLSSSPLNDSYHTHVAGISSDGPSHRASSDKSLSELYKKFSPSVSPSSSTKALNELSAFWSTPTDSVITLRRAKSQRAITPSTKLPNLDNVSNIQPSEAQPSAFDTLTARSDTLLQKLSHRRTRSDSITVEGENIAHDSIELAKIEELGLPPSTPNPAVLAPLEFATPISSDKLDGNGDEVESTGSTIDPQNSAQLRLAESISSQLVSLTHYNHEEEDEYLSTNRIHGNQSSSSVARSGAAPGSIASEIPDIFDHLAFISQSSPRKNELDTVQMAESDHVSRIEPKEFSKIDGAGEVFGPLSSNPFLAPTITHGSSNSSTSNLIDNNISNPSLNSNSISSAKNTFYPESSNNSRTSSPKMTRATPSPAVSEWPPISPSQTRHALHSTPQIHRSSMLLSGIFDRSTVDIQSPNPSVKADYRSFLKSGITESQGSDSTRDNRHRKSSRSSLMGATLNSPTLGGSSTSRSDPMDLTIVEDEYDDGPVFSLEEIHEEGDSIKTTSVLDPSNDDVVIEIAPGFSFKKGMTLKELESFHGAMIQATLAPDQSVFDQEGHHFDDELQNLDENGIGSSLTPRYHRTRSSTGESGAIFGLGFSSSTTSSSATDSRPSSSRIISSPLISPREMNQPSTGASNHLQLSSEIPTGNCSSLVGSSSKSLTASSQALRQQISPQRQQSQYQRNRQHQRGRSSSSSSTPLGNATLRADALTTSSSPSPRSLSSSSDFIGMDSLLHDLRQEIVPDRTHTTASVDSDDSDVDHTTMARVSLHNDEEVIRKESRLVSPKDSSNVQIEVIPPDLDESDEDELFGRGYVDEDDPNHLNRASRELDGTKLRIKEIETMQTACYHQQQPSSQMLQTQQNQQRRSRSSTYATRIVRSSTYHDPASARKVSDEDIMTDTYKQSSYPSFSSQNRFNPGFVDPTPLNLQLEVPGGRIIHRRNRSTPNPSNRKKSPTSSRTGSQDRSSLRPTGSLMLPLKLDTISPDNIFHHYAHNSTSHVVSSSSGNNSICSRLPLSPRYSDSQSLGECRTGSTVVDIASMPISPTGNRFDDDTLERSPYQLSDYGTSGGSGIFYENEEFELDDSEEENNPFVLSNLHFDNNQDLSISYQQSQFQKQQHPQFHHRQSVQQQHYRPRRQSKSEGLSPSQLTAQSLPVVRLASSPRPNRYTTEMNDMNDVLARLSLGTSPGPKDLSRHRRNPSQSRLERRIKELERRLELIEKFQQQPPVGNGDGYVNVHHQPPQSFNNPSSSSSYSTLSPSSSLNSYPLSSAQQQQLFQQIGQSNCTSTPHRTSSGGLSASPSLSNANLAGKSSSPNVSPTNSNTIQQQSGLTSTNNVSAPPASENSTSCNTTTTLSTNQKYAPNDHAYNRRFQEIIQLSGPSKYIQMAAVGRDFVRLAQIYGRIIISERCLPAEQKSIKPVALGGQAGGSKFLVQGILFKYALDVKISTRSGKEKWLYGGTRRDDASAMKAASNELLGLCSFMKCSNNAIRFPMMALIDYFGYRLVAVSTLPINNDTLVYGSADAGKSVLNKDEYVSKTMAEYGHDLNLREHLVFNTPIMGPGDLEVHKGLDGYYYMIDFARTFPPEAPGENSNPQSIFHKLLRPEVVRMSAQPLSSDAFSGWQTSDSQADTLNRDVVETTRLLFEQLIPSYAKEYVSNVDFQKHLKSEICLIADLHRKGINLRHLGRVRSEMLKVTKEMDSLYLVEMICRTLKSYLSSRYRALMDDLIIFAEEPFREEALLLFNLVGQPSQETEFWHKRIKELILYKYGPTALRAEEMDPNVMLLDLLPQEYRMYLFERLSYHVEVKFDNNIWAIVSEAVQNGTEFEFFLQDIKEIKPRIKYMTILDLAQAISLYLQAAGMTDDSRKEANLLLLQEARDRLVTSWTRISDDLVIRYFLGKVWYLMGKLRSDGASDFARSVIMIESTMVAQDPQQEQEDLKIDFAKAAVMAYIHKTEQHRFELAKTHFRNVMSTKPFLANTLRSDLLTWISSQHSNKQVSDVSFATRVSAIEKATKALYENPQDFESFRKELHSITSKPRPAYIQTDRSSKRKQFSTPGRMFPF